MTTLTAERARSLVRYEHGALYWLDGCNARSTRSVGSRAGAICGKYRRIGLDGRRYLEHRVIWLIVYGKWPANQIDHINGDPLDNRIENMRDVPARINLQNRRRALRTSTTGVLGVSPDPARPGVMRARIGGKHLGFFRSTEDAQEAYIVAKRETHEGNTL